MSVEKELQICKDAIMVLNKWLDIEFYGVTSLTADEASIVHALFVARAVFEDLVNRYEKSLEGIDDGIGQVMKILKDKGYSAIAEEIMSEIRDRA